MQDTPAFNWVAGLGGSGGYAPARATAGQGSGVASANPWLRSVRSPYDDGEELLAMPEGDLLVHAGDALFKNLDADQKPSIERVSAWLGKQRCRKAILIGGNHEICLDEMGSAACKRAFAGYIQDEMVHFDGLRIYGTPLSRPYKHGGESEEGDALGANKAFQTNSFARVASIPDAGVDVLITHGAPRGILDTILLHGDNAHVHEEVGKV